jgi:hypothetical protein
MQFEIYASRGSEAAIPTAHGHLHELCSAACIDRWPLTFTYKVLSHPCPVAQLCNASTRLTSMSNWTSGGLLPRHVGEPRQVQLVCNGHRLGRAVAVLGQNQVGLAAARVIALERIGPVQQDDHVRILF